VDVIIRPDGRQGTRKSEALSREDVKRIMDFEAWCTSRGIKLDMFCSKCWNEYGPKGARMWGNNSRDSQAWHLECQCTDRAYGTGITPRAAAQPADRKIQIDVP
jgi:hypothetical protein